MNNLYQDQLIGTFKCVLMTKLNRIEKKPGLLRDLQAFVN